MNSPVNIYQKIRVYKHQLSIILANASDVDIASLQYSTYSMQLIDDEEGIAFVSSRPYYSIESIPAHTYLELEKLDRHEDGALFYVFEKVMWADGTEDENIQNVRIGDLSNFTMAFSSPFMNMTKISRDKTFIKSDEGYEKQL
jgi:hypothetical protein